MVNRHGGKLARHRFSSLVSLPWRDNALPRLRVVDRIETWRVNLHDELDELTGSTAMPSILLGRSFYRPNNNPLICPSVSCSRTVSIT